MPRQLTSSELSRIYVCLANCRRCGARRGKLCLGHNGKRMKSNHAGRCTRHDTKRGAPLHNQYLKLKTQILNPIEVIGHE